MDCSLPGFSVPGILQARTLEWVALSFSNAWKWKVKVKSLSRVWLLASPWTVAYQAPPFMGFSGQQYWSGVPIPFITSSCGNGFGNIFFVREQKDNLVFRLAHLVKMSSFLMKCVKHATSTICTPILFRTATRLCPTKRNSDTFSFSCFPSKEKKKCYRCYIISLIAGKWYIPIEENLHFDEFSMRMESSIYNFTSPQSSFWLPIKPHFSCITHKAPVSGTIHHQTHLCCDMTWVLLFVMILDKWFRGPFLHWVGK